jgi:hypothetical protein
MRENLHEVIDFIDLVAPLAPFRIDFHPVRHSAAGSSTTGPAGPSTVVYSAAKHSATNTTR